ncbi:putative thiamine transport system ATP-binding protein [Nitratireductor aquibiodomus]|uniref:Putative thiamine transport system ATP-binding protein n=2 Tax=Nitratireductor aquibiodomus TaxID=204799 RepID=A0A1H4LL19_9HYPH|nr:ATP-binding cassette domain-containing protein [Nitratireductor aquibiodomus]SEB71413.1 putative thiamine transport system ATP-binding protein [Nitratireductor aquibiodomus]
MDAGLFIDGVTIALEEREIVSLTKRVAPGGVLTVMGPSGAGKSTLLAYIGGFLDPVFSARGRVFVDGTEVTALKPEDRHVGVLFQDPLLFPHMSVGGNLMFALPEAVRGRAARAERVAQALEGVGLAGLEARDPATLSGGQKARVALARVLASSPRALLLDEPFSKLDAELRAQTRELVFSKARENGLPVLLVTHDAADAEAASGDIVRIGE